MKPLAVHKIDLIEGSDDVLKVYGRGTVDQVSTLDTVGDEAVVFVEASCCAGNAAEAGESEAKVSGGLRGTLQFWRTGVEYA